MTAMFFVNPEKRRQWMLVAGDALIVLGALAVAYLARVFLLGQPLDVALDRLAGPWAAMVVTVHLLALFVFDQYSMSGRFLKGRRLTSISLAVLSATAVCAVLRFFITSGPAIGRMVLALAVPLIVAGAFLWRAAWAAASAGGRRRKAVIVGGGRAVEELARDLAGTPLWDCEVVAVVRLPGHAAPDLPAGVLVLDAGWADLDQFVAGVRPDVVIYDLSVRSSQIADEALLRLRLNGLEVTSLPDFAARYAGRVPVHAIDSEWVLEALSADKENPVWNNAKRIAEVGLASVLLVLLSPVLALIALAIRLDSRGSALFRQERLGRDELPFTAYKFRTMVEHAEETTGPMWATANDARVTRVGRVLRGTGLDELPQLLNIVRGDMAFIGFRPIRRHFADRLEREIPFYRLRFRIRPGITGWPQVRHDYAGSTGGQLEKFEYELFYLRYASPLLDFYIILKTLQKLVLGRVGMTHAVERPRPASPDASKPEYAPRSART
jgi:exopolysaccharide biosynthesis polyprenyl glycosylphosphotransferase